MAASSASADSRTLEQVTKENEALEKELAALRSALGIDAKEAAEEKARVQAIFTKYDVDKSGFIDRAKFDLLAFEAGVGAEALDEKGITEIFATIKPANPTAGVTFAEFNSWFEASKKIPRSERKAGSLALAAKLQSKALVKTLEASKSALRAAKAKVPERKAAERKEVKAIVAEAGDGIQIAVRVGEFKEAATSIVITVKTDEKSTAALKKEIEVPAGKGAFAFIDLGVVAGADEGKLGELAGILDSLLGALGTGLNEKAGIPVYHGHGVKLVGSGDARVLRISFFAELSPTELLAAQLGKDASVFNPGGLLDLRIAIETPVGLALLRDDAARLSVSQILARVTIDGSLSSTLDARIREAAAGAIPEGKAALVGAAVRLFRGLKLNVNAISLDELSTKFSTPFDGEHLRNAHEALRFYGEMLPTLPLKALFEAQIGGVAAMGSELPPEVQMIYGMVRALLTGPKKLHAQVDDLQVEIAFTGLDIFAFAPALPTA